MEMRTARNHSIAKKRGGIELAAQKKTKKAILGQIDSEKAEIDEVGIPDAEAVSMVQKLFDLSDKEAAVLGGVLCKLEDGVVLIFRENPNWRRRGGASANAILDAIAVYDMPAPQRRDRGDGCSRWLFQFRNSSDINPCKHAILALHPTAFALSPDSFAFLAGAGAAIAPNVHTQIAQPLAHAVVINKVAITRSDVLQFPFFYT